MSLMHRSPPCPSKTTNKQCLDHSLSAPNLKEAVDNDDFVNLLSRYKRPRMEAMSSPTSCDLDDDLKCEIKMMLSSWKTEQANLTKLVADQNILMTRMISDMSELKTQYGNIEKSNKEIEKSIAFVNEQYEVFQNQIKILQTETQKNREYTESLERKIYDLQHKSRSSTIEIRNVPSSEKESLSDLNNILSAVGKTIKSPISPSDLRDIYRAPGKAGTIRPIVTEFSTVQKKLNFLSSVRMFNKQQTRDSKLNTTHIGITGKQQPIYVDEHVSPSNKKLFYLSREFSKQHGYTFCWISNGNIFLKKRPGDKQILVKSESTLKELLEAK